MKNFLLVACFFALVQTLSAQSVKGFIKDAQGAPVAYATVTLHQAKDSALVKGALSGDDGAYNIDGISAGQYFLKASLIGFGDGKTAAFFFDGQGYTAPDLTIAEAQNELKTVTVSARKPVVEVKADKTILNVEGTVNSAGLNALELLRKAPGVTVDNNENVNVKGKNAVRVMIDGRDVPLDGKDLAALLKGTQAADVANIEIISNPSAKYDASGNAGIINIKLKKNKSLGTNGNFSIDAIYGITPKIGSSISLNHRNKKLSLFGTYNNHFGNWHNTNTFYREQSGLVFDQETEQYNESRWNSARIGADWFINDKHTVGALVNGNYDPGDWHSTSIAKIGNQQVSESLDSLLDASNDMEGDRRDLNLNLNYRFADTSGHSFNFDIDRGQYRIRGASYQPNYYLKPDGTTLLNERIYRNNTPTDIVILSAKGDYEQRLWKGTFGTGFKVVDVRTDNTFDFFNVIEGNPVKDLNVSNRFKYKERTTAAYVNYNRAFGKKLNVQAGLRMEHTDYSGELIAEKPQNEDSIENTYTELFPSAAITYSINKKIGLNLTYSRRIDRPSYQDLNPFENKLDELTYSKGNPMLRPQFTHSFELSPTYSGFPILTLGYSRTRDVFTQVLDTTNVRATFITQENIADQENYTLSVNIPTKINKWWDGFISVTGMSSRFEAKFREGFEVNQQFEAFNLYAEQTFKLPKDFSIQLSGWYNSRAFWGTLRSEPQGAMDLGIQKKLFKDKGTLRLRVGDILRTAGWAGENVFSPGLYMLAKGTWESRTTTLSFSYRFGNSDVKAARQRKTGLEDESRRVKGKG